MPPPRLRKKPPPSHVDLAALRKTANRKLDDKGQGALAKRLLLALNTGRDRPERRNRHLRDATDRSAAQLIREQVRFHQKLHRTGWLDPQQLNADDESSCPDPLACDGPDILVAHGKFIGGLIERARLEHIARGLVYADPLPSRAGALHVLNVRCGLSYGEIVALANPRLRKLSEAEMQAREASLREAKSTAGRTNTRSHVRKRKTANTRS